MPDRVEPVTDRWTLLKEYLTTQISQDLAVAESFGPDNQTGAVHYSLVSANRSTLGKMSELEKQQ